jgi:predicted aspartyl protease
LITGFVSAEREPTVILEVAGRNWEAVVDTGFNGDLELPIALKRMLPCRFFGQVTSLLAGNQRIDEDAFHVDFPFDGQIVLAEATFVPGRQILIGTRLLKAYRLEIDFPKRTLRLDRA